MTENNNFLHYINTQEFVQSCLNKLEKDEDEWILWDKEKTKILGRHKKKTDAIKQEIAIELAKKREKIKDIDGTVLPISAYEQDLEVEELEIIETLD